jgi:hypothetical protein
MARIRSVHPGLFIDDAFMELSMAARMLLIGIWVQCDDHGIFEWRPKSLKAAIFPGDDGLDVPGLLDELTLHKFIKPFQHEGKAYGAARNFCIYQRPQKPSFRHPLTDWCGSYTGISRRKAGETEEESGSATVVQEASDSTTGSSSHRNRSRSRSRKGEEGEKKSFQSTTKPVERVPLVGDRSAAASQPQTLSQVSKPVLKEVGSKGRGLGSIIGTELPADWIPSDELCEQVKADFGMTDADLQAEVPAFHALNAQGGTRSKDWNATFKLFCKRWKEHKDKQAPPRVEVSRQPEPVNSNLFKPTDEQWEGCIRLYAQTGRWGAQFGPDPMSRACRAPRALLQKYGIDLETGEPPRRARA